MCDSDAAIAFSMHCTGDLRRVYIEIKDKSRKMTTAATIETTSTTKWKMRIKLKKSIKIELKIWKPNRTEKKNERKKKKTKLNALRWCSNALTADCQKHSISPNKNDRPNCFDFYVTGKFENPFTGLILISDGHWHRSTTKLWCNAFGFALFFKKINVIFGIEFQCGSILLLSLHCHLSKKTQHGMYHSNAFLFLCSRDVFTLNIQSNIVYVYSMLSYACASMWLCICLLCDDK